MRLRHHVRRHLGLLGATVLAVVGGASGSVAQNQEPSPDKVQAAYQSRGTSPGPVKQITVAAVGDSITEGNSPDFNNGRLDALSWPSHLPANQRLVGGWARGGATTGTMLANVTPVYSDVAVIIAGTNDLGHMNFAQSASNIEGIVATVGATRTIISAIPPFDRAPEWAVSYNRQMETFASAHGWEFVDAMAGVRAANDRYIPSLTFDGIHPNVKGVERISAVLARSITGQRMPSITHAGFWVNPSRACYAPAARFSIPELLCLAISDGAARW
jgi:lysophospholipase L1-like esterase